MMKAAFSTQQSAFRRLWSLSAT